MKVGTDEEVVRKERDDKVEGLRCSNEVPKAKGKRSLGSAAVASTVKVESLEGKSADLE